MAPCPHNQVRSLVLTPTRENTVAPGGRKRAGFGQYLDLRQVIVYLFGGVKINPQMQRRAAAPNVLVGHPRAG